MLPDLYKRTWNSAFSDSVGLSNLAGELLQLLTKLFATSLLPDQQHALQEYCVDKFAKKSSEAASIDYAKLADPATNCLVLIYADSPLLLKLLHIFNLISAHTRRSHDTNVSLYYTFIMFLYNNCHDQSCFFQPIQHILNTSPVGTRFSNLFISLITWDPAFITKQERTQGQAMKFILSGGGKVVLKCLIESGPVKQSPDYRDSISAKGLSIKAINKLGQKYTPPKTINENSGLVNFFPLSYSTIETTKGVRVLTSPRPLLFVHLFPPNEKCIKLHVAFPYPVLLHNFIFCLVNLEVGGMTNGNPSKIAIHCSLHGPESTFPVTPIYKTDGLKMVNIACYHPVLAQHVVVYFYRPLLSGRTITVSKVEMLGTSFGSSAEAVVPRSKPTVLDSQMEKQQQG